MGKKDMPLALLSKAEGDSSPDTKGRAAEI